MKEKAIEKIPYLTLPKVVKGKTCKYVGVTALMDIGGEQHLLLEIYKNQKDCKKVPIVRIAVTAKDYGNYTPDTGIWDRRKIETDYYYSYGLIWYDRSLGRGDIEKINRLYTKEDADRINKMCSEGAYDGKWWSYIYRHEDAIDTARRRAAERSRYEKRKKGLEERAALTPELNEPAIIDRVDKIYFRQKHFLYYKKTGARVQLACSACGGVTDGRWKAGESYESQYMSLLSEPRRGDYGTCPLCKARGVYKCQGTVKGARRESVNVFLGQKYKETGLVLRYIQVDKDWNLELLATDKGVEMYKAQERLSCVEIARIYYDPSGTVQTDYQKGNPYTGENFWDDCNLSGMSSIRINTAAVLRETYEQMQGTIFQYCAMQEYDAQSRAVFNAVDYLDSYRQMPQLEMLVKLGLTGVVQEILYGHLRIIANDKAKRPDVFLGINKNRVKLLIEENGSRSILEVLQAEKKLKQHWTREQIKELAGMDADLLRINAAVRFMSIQKFINHVKKYAVSEYCTGGLARDGRQIPEGMMRQTAQLYTDYLTLREELGYDMHNTVYLYPRNLHDAHARMAKEGNEKQLDIRLKEVNLKYPEIEKNYRRLRKRYYYADDEYLIRPARSAAEIVMEGRLQHHCVGGDTYLGKHNNGYSYILLLRRKKSEKTPYITVEINAEKTAVMQWYGAHDKKPDEKNMQRWLDNYIKTLKTGAVEDRILTPAI